MINIKKKNGIDIMNKRNKKQKLKEFRKQMKIIERTHTDRTAIEEAKLLLHVLIFQFDGYARQQQLIIEHMSSSFHWGNKRTIRVLKTMAAIGVVDRWKSESDNWTLFFLVKGFLEECKDRIIRATLAITERIKRSFSSIISINRANIGNNHAIWLPI